MTESTMSFFLYLAVFCGICVALLNRSATNIHNTNIPDTFIAFFFFDK